MSAPRRFSLTGLGAAAALALILSAAGCGGGGPEADGSRLPRELRDYVASVEFDTLGGNEPAVTVEREGDGRYRVRAVFDLDEDTAQDDWRVRIRPAFPASFHWAPHLTPGDEHIIDQHIFRSPALIAASGSQRLAVIPDLDILGRGTAVRWYMDLDAPAGVLTLGAADTEVVPGMFFTRKPGAVHPAGRMEFGFFLLASSRKEDVENPWREPLEFMWETWGRPRFEAGYPLPPDLTPYVEHTYRWAFETWKDSVWQEFELDGTRVGAPVFIVNITQSPNYPGEINERAFRSIWNQAWFGSLRSASGLYRHARRTGNGDLLEKANLTKELALAAPVREGFFPSVIATKMKKVEIAGEMCNRSLGWGTAFWGNSNRNPVNRPPGRPRIRDAGIAPYHVLDMSWTALSMLRWYRELEADERLTAYARNYAEALLKLQDDQGYFPAWLDLENLAPLGILDQSPESSMSVTFLLELAGITGEDRYREAALKAMAAVARDIVPAGRWEDFETYWSSSSYGSGDLIGERVTRNNMFKQCNFSMFWTAEALFETWKATGDRAWLNTGERVLDELLMTQASWQPPYMYVDVLGGFGVMNADGEWLDARQSLFAEIILRYGLELEREEYVQRALAALRASFVMMYCPENPAAKIQWEKRHPFFGPDDYGFTMENYGHGGRTGPEGLGMGVFTIYDWGNGAAAEAWNRMLDKYGPEMLLRDR
jgi:hypothetical protein